MLCWSNESSAPSPDCASAARTRARRYSCSRRKSTRSSKSTCVRPGACSGRSQRCFGSMSSERGPSPSRLLARTILSRIPGVVVPQDGRPHFIFHRRLLLEKLGLAPADARLVAETLVESNLRGVDSHGVVRLPHYATRLRNGTVKARPTSRCGAPGLRPRWSKAMPAWANSWPRAPCRKPFPSQGKPASAPSARATARTAARAPIRRDGGARRHDRRGAHAHRLRSWCRPG